MESWTHLGRHREPGDELIEEELFAADWAEARAGWERGCAGAPSPARPSNAGRRPWWRWARKAMDIFAGDRLPEPSFTVLVGYKTLLRGRNSELASGGVVSPGSRLPSLDQAWAERSVFDGPTGS